MNLSIVTAPKRNSRHWTAGTISWDTIRSWMLKPASAKEAGNYVLGELRPTTVVHPGETAKCGPQLHRRNFAVVTRSALTLDVDYPDEGFLERLTEWLPAGTACIVHTTFSSTPSEPRYRLLLPLARPVAPDEYVIASKAVMQALGVGCFDKTTDQPVRYMFKPAARKPDWFEWHEYGDQPLDPDPLLESFEEDLAGKDLPKPGANKRDPFAIDGPVGAFNRVYQDDWQLLIERYELPYEPDTADRWHLVGARSAAGMGVVAPGLVYSHHANDPAGGKACSAFDLVRLHLFGELDEDAKPGTPINRLPSSTAMVDLARQDPRVLAEFVGADFDEEMDEVTEEDSWKLHLRLTRAGQLVDCIENWDLVRKHDPVFGLLYFNEMSMAVEVSGDLPWRTLDQGGPTFGSMDRAALAHHMERTYHLRPPRFLVDELVVTTAHKRYVSPVADYLRSLKWDGVERLEECLPGVRPTAYTRMVARKCMVAAVARALDPGCKWDHSLVLFGEEGLGKSWWIDKISRGFSASLGPIGSKDTLLIMQRSWIMISDEGHSLRKADADVQKEFLTRTADVFRLPYERESIMHPRRCVIWGSTNDDVFLRRQEGNRRFLIVHCEDEVNFAGITDEYVDQLWAEAMVLYQAGEALYLEGLEKLVARVEREQYVEEDALAGIVEHFLDTPIPNDWDTRSPDQRRMYLQDRADGMASGSARIMQVCSAQIWAEALGKRLGDHRRTDLLEINAVLKRIPGWRQLPGRHRVPNYGPQLVFERVTDAG